jgi:hypothetical protein
MSFDWSRAGVCICLLSLPACNSGPQWSGTERVSVADGIGMFMPAALATVDSLPQPVASDTLFCPGSFRVIATDSSNRFAVWWSSRASSRAQLMFAMTGDGGRTWSEATVVDGRDEGTRGCERPAPDIFTVSESEYVHVVYWIEPPGQPGVYFSHSMDNGHMFHAPVAVSYGDKPSRATVAARGDTVAVAYEDPNSARPRVCGSRCPSRPATSLSSAWTCRATPRRNHPRR